jgi:hypothetical protein
LPISYIMNKRGYYIKKSKVDQSLYLFIEINDFIEYVKTNIKDGSNNWVKFRIFEREKESEQFSHDMQIIK